MRNLSKVYEGWYTVAGERHHLLVERDAWGKFYVTVDGVRAGPRLSAVSMVSWFAGTFMEKNQ